MAQQSTSKELFLPEKGLVREKAVLPFVGYGRTKWRSLVAAGKAPPSRKLSPKVVVYSAEEIHRWIAEQLAA